MFSLQCRNGFGRDFADVHAQFRAKRRQMQSKRDQKILGVTNVDRVAADIKHNVHALRGQKVFTREHQHTPREIGGKGDLCHP